MSEIAVTKPDDRAALAILRAYRDPLFFWDVNERFKAWFDAPRAWSAFGSLCSLGTDFFDYSAILVEMNERKQAWPTNAGRAACPPDTLPAPLRFAYVNYRGERSERRALPVRVYHGATDFHPEPQWLLVALDTEKGEDRTFAMKDMEILR